MPLRGSYLQRAAAPCYAFTDNQFIDLAERLETAKLINNEHNVHEGGMH